VAYLWKKEIHGYEGRGKIFFSKLIREI
jgi:hypothetical protein